MAVIFYVWNPDSTAAGGAAADAKNGITPSAGKEYPSWGKSVSHGDVLPRRGNPLYRLE